MWLWIAIVLLGAVIAWLLANDWLFLMNRRISVRGTVIDHKRDDDGDGSVYFKPIVRYKADNGREYVITDYVGLAKPAHKVGATVAVTYPRGYPDRGRVQRLWIKPTLYAMLGIGFALLVAKRLGWLG